MARDAIYSLLAQDDELIGLGVKNFYASNATDTPKRDGMFIVITYGNSDHAFRGVDIENVTIWVHMPKEIERSYRAIDPALERIKTLMLEATQKVGSDGFVLTGATDQGKSQDLYDSAYETLCKNIAFRVASRYVGYVSTG